MASFFKKFLQGIIYIIIFPVFLVALAVGAVFCLFILVIQLILFVFNFFTGRSIKGELQEDVEAKAIIEKQNRINEPVDIPQTFEQSLTKEPIREEVKEPTIEETVFQPFEEPEPVKEEPFLQEEEENNDTSPFEDFFREEKIQEPIQPEPQKEDKSFFEVKDDTPEIYHPRTNNYQQDFDDDKNDSYADEGVDISYDD